MWSKLKQLFRRNQVDPEFWDGLEATLLSGDVGPALTTQWMAILKKNKTTDEAEGQLRDLLETQLQKLQKPFECRARPHVILVLGINGVGKTTSIAKLAAYFQKQGRSVVMVAADTFRAAAVEQLQEWGRRLSVPVVAQKMGSDPASVAFDGVQSGVASAADVVIVDTAGRMHNKANLLEELKKIHRVVAKAQAGAPHDTWVVMDATVGQNALQQVEQFSQAVPLTGLLVSKWDGEARSGVICSLTLPIYFVGTGEGINHLEPFSAASFADRLLA